MKKLILFVLAMSLAVPPSALAREIGTGRKDPVRVFEGAKSLAEIVERAKPVLNETEFRFAKAKVAESVGAKAPRLTRLGSTGAITVEFNGSKIHFAIDSREEESYLINRRKVVLKGGEGLEAWWPKIEAALPAKSAGVRLFLPEARAFIPLGLVLSIGIIVSIERYATMCNAVKSANGQCTYALEDVRKVSSYDPVKREQKIREMKANYPAWRASREALLNKHVWDCEPFYTELKNCTFQLESQVKSVLGIDLEKPERADPASSSSSRP
jgi:hypothetical protein